MFDADAVQAACVRCVVSRGDVLRALETALQPGPYILGERFSAADVYVAAQLEYALMMKRIEPRPQFDAYLARIVSRPARLRAIEQDDALAAKLKA